MLKRMIGGVARRLGLEVVDPSHVYATQVSLRGLILQENINLILDVGANVGQFAHSVRKAVTRTAYIV